MIEYQLLKADRVSLKIYTILGEDVRNLVDEERPAGFHRVKWDGANDGRQKLNSGTYLYEIRAGDLAQVKKLVLLK